MLPCFAYRLPCVGALKVIALTAYYWHSNVLAIAVQVILLIYPASGLLCLCLSAKLEQAEKDQTLLK